VWDTRCRDPREACVLRLRYGLGGDNDQTLADMGRDVESRRSVSGKSRRMR
jgi:hypothetical protein